jgi:type IV pilus assembly protein PilY1
LALTSLRGGAEDIELYVNEAKQQEVKRPQVLIMFDTSGSMGWNELVKERYNPKINYRDYDPLNLPTEAAEAIPVVNIYYQRGDSTVPPNPGDVNEKKYFLNAINSCASSKDLLKNGGVYTGRTRQYSVTDNQGQWLELSESDASGVTIVDCEDDLLKLNKQNATGQPDGFPLNFQNSSEASNEPLAFTPLASNSNVSWSSTFVTLYSDNYLRWYHNSDIPNEWRSRMSIAKESVESLINSTGSVDFGLMRFNRGNGGRIINGINEMTEEAKTNLITNVQNLPAGGGTPLCESLYEAGLFFAGEAMKWGDTNDTDEAVYDESTPVYKSPFSGCTERAYIIMVSDGQPSRSDNSADSLIRGLPGIGAVYSDSNVRSSYIPALADWLSQNDVNTTLNGKQTIELYTIGFGAGALNAAGVLKEAADLSGGKYFPATDANKLTGALINVIANLKPTNKSLTSASVGVDNFDRTQSLNSVYYGMFEPSTGARWKGNIKKYKVVSGRQVGINNVSAITTDGTISNGVQSFWSSTQDGAVVSQGGVAEIYQMMTKGRTIYSDIANDGALEELTFTSAKTSFGSSENLAVHLGVVNDDDVMKEYLKWARGENVNSDTPYMRPDVFGDPLHSKPLVISYDTNVTYLVVGTNQGALHMFKDDDANNTVTEEWAFMPKELFANIKGLRENLPSTDKIYGIDGQITLHFDDTNGDGKVNESEGDKVWLFFGLRRGGDSYYGLDVTDPEDPKMLWHIKGGAEGFEELGQTWSQPKVAYSKLNKGHENEPVLIFGGGYDTNKDADTAGTDDKVGKAIYMVDAESGEKIWSLAKGGDTSFSGTDSIPSSIATLDSIGDGFTDRLYAGDTGGNVWRVDIPDDKKDNISVFKLASLAGSGDEFDRRFFNEPTIARAIITETIKTTVTTDSGTEDITVKKEIPYDAVLIGSGDRTNPLGSKTKNSFFTIKDLNIQTKTFLTENKPDPIEKGSLSDFTDNPFGNVAEEDLEALSLEVSQQLGWYFDFDIPGEKSTASGLVINNIAYFTSYTPPSELSEEEIAQCKIADGSGWLYAVDLSLGTKSHHWVESGEDREDRIKHISNEFLDAPTLVINNTVETVDGVDTVVTNEMILVGKVGVGVDLGFKTLRTYLYIVEQ